jgi:decaprenylphospho-beta-D-ribofuranose 2-oxidase
MTELCGWGRYPRVQAHVQQPFSVAACAHALLGKEPVIARGLGRSYGDSALASRVVSMQRLDRYRSFDPTNGVIWCDAGVSLEAILHVAVPRGWFLPVTPGTRHVTVGGAVASDVHGKNHHLDGTFGMHVRQLEILLGNGEIVVASPVENRELFRATCGGMGLTGVILSVMLQLKRIVASDIVQTTMRMPDLEAVLDAFDVHAAKPYSVAWIDGLAAGNRLGRSLLMLGEHATDGELRTDQRAPVRVPFEAPGALLTSATARMFNALYYRSAAHKPRSRQVAFERFFYPLDALSDWNRLYGPAGFVQYQIALPRAVGRNALREILARIAHSGHASFLAVLKRLGPANANLLSFPLDGYTLALDFKAQPGVFELLDLLDAAVLHHGGRIYLAKDARMSQATFRRGYPQWDQFEAVRANCHAHGHFASAQSLRLGLS